MEDREFIKVGRGHDAEVRITDISVSRCHALIKKSSRGDYVVEDNSSKFGTLVLVRKPIILNQNQINYVQLGRSIVELTLKEPSKKCTLRSICAGGKNKVQKGI
jgi:pSer/pThr/pTyr-binding forkhead associated (FHA) protein